MFSCVFVCECFCCLIRLCALFVMCCVLSDMFCSCVLSVRVLFDVKCVSAFCVRLRMRSCMVCICVFVIVRVVFLLINVFVCLGCDLGCDDVWFVLVMCVFM